MCRCCTHACYSIESLSRRWLLPSDSALVSQSALTFCRPALGQLLTFRQSHNKRTTLSSARCRAPSISSYAPQKKARHTNGTSTVEPLLHDSRRARSRHLPQVRMRQTSNGRLLPQFQLTSAEETDKMVTLLKDPTPMHSVWAVRCSVMVPRCDSEVQQE